MTLSASPAARPKSGGSPAEPAADFAAEWAAWRAANEARRRDRYGFLSYAGVYRLGAMPSAVPGLPGRWSLRAEGPAVEPSPVVELDGDESLVVDERVVTGRHVFAPLAEREFRRAARAGDVVIELSKRGGIDLLRPLDPSHGLRDAYVETPAYAPDPAWLVAGEFLPFPAPRPTAIDAAIEGITHRHDAVGEVLLRRDGAEHRLLFLAAPAGAPGAAFAVFTDATSGVTTYPASRTLHTVLPAGGGPVLLDFNRAANLQCAYTDFAPCPLAPAQNRLPFAVEAGERTPVFRDRAPRSRRSV
ncbi:MAG: DUF1684 domain-containing protein [Microbacteriaceae bacterium]